MPCMKIKDGYVCSHAMHRVYLCFEARTYIMEFSERFGPEWFTVPGEDNISPPDPEGSMAFLWDAFDEWYKKAA